MAKFEGGLGNDTQNTGTMNALKALYDAGYTVTLDRDDKDPITLKKGDTDDYKTSILAYIEDLMKITGVERTSTITVTINGLNGNSMTGYVELSIDVPVNKP